MFAFQKKYYFLMAILHIRQQYNSGICCKRQILVALFLLLISVFSASAQTDIKVLNVNKQQAFLDEIPAGEYSGICHVSADTFAVVSDKSEGLGFYLWKIQTDSVSGRITAAQNLGYKGSGVGAMDIEGVAFNPHTNTIFVSQESNHSIAELTLDGIATGRQITLPDSISRNIRSNMSLESLCYDKDSRVLWTATEGALRMDGDIPSATNGKETTVRLFAFDDSLQMSSWYKYVTDKPSATKSARLFTLGVSDLAAIGDGQLLVLEREARVTDNYIGSSTTTKVYVVDTKNAAIGTVLPKKLLLSFKTKLNLSRRDWANFEGLCIAPTATDGINTLVFVSDSQGQYKGVLKDWLKTVRISGKY